MDEYENNLLKKYGWPNQNRCANRNLLLDRQKVVFDKNADEIYAFDQLEIQLKKGIEISFDFNFYNEEPDSENEYVPLYNVINEDYIIIGETTQPISILIGLSGCVYTDFSGIVCMIGNSIVQAVKNINSGHEGRLLGTYHEGSGRSLSGTL